ncbi:hypothetical protein TH61_03285 [Rufibacter sp. DG15C]|nr:hypothetical protein TH61_03285 [Rufibacter sp. DG15C]
MVLALTCIFAVKVNGFEKDIFAWFNLVPAVGSGKPRLHAQDVPKQENEKLPAPSTLGQGHSLPHKRLLISFF